MKVWIVQVDSHEPDADIVAAYSTEEAAKSLANRTGWNVIELPLDDPMEDLYCYIAYGPGSVRPDLPCKDWPSSSVPATKTFSRKQRIWKGSDCGGWTEEVIEVHGYGRTPEEASRKSLARLVELVEQGSVATA